MFHLRFGQLGCSGFIISDREGNFISRKTKAFLQYEDGAFRHVEELLLKNFGIQPSARPRVSESDSEEDVMGTNWSLPSVGIASMDDEHEKCEEALSTLLRMPNVRSLTKVMELLTEHFQHEESLMKASGFGNPNQPFSPYANHVQDHERILDIGYIELAKQSKEEEPNKSFTSMTCSEAQMKDPYKSFIEMKCSDTSDDTWHRPVDNVVKVDLSVAEKIVREFRLHATRFDMLYEGRIQDSRK